MARRLSAASGRAMNRGRSAWAWVVLAGVLIGTAAVRVRLLDVPLDRDEGEYAYMAQLMLDGIPPYARAYNMKTPGIYGAYAAVLAVFGQTTRAVHVGLLIANALGITLTFALARRLAGPPAGAIGAATFATLTVSSAMLGMTAYAEHFVVVPALAGLLVLLHAIDARRTVLFVAAGVLLGLAYVVKQSGGAFVLLGVAYAAAALGRRGQPAVSASRPALDGSGAATSGGPTTVGDARKGAATPPPPGAGGRRDAMDWRSLAALAAGVIAPLAIVALVLVATGTFATFWFWAVSYSAHYATAIPLEPAIWHFLGMATIVAAPAWAIYAAAGLGLIALLIDPALRSARPFVIAWLAFSFLAVTPGLYFRRQYFVLMAPAVACLAALAPVVLARRCPRMRALAVTVAVVLAVLPVVQALASDRQLLFQASPLDVARTLYQSNPFVESPEVARYIRERTRPTDTIAVIGSEPQIYFYAQRRGATGYIYMYPLMEAHPYAARMQRQMIEELEGSPPTFLVLVNVNTSWLITPRSEKILSEWFAGYWPRFERVGLVEIGSPAPSRFYWDDAARAREPATPLWLAVYRRRDDGLPATGALSAPTHPR